MTNAVSRRAFLIETLGALLSLSTVALARTAHARGTAADRWLGELEHVSRAVTTGRASPRAWRRRVERVSRHVPLGELLRVIDLDAFAAGLVAGDGTEPQLTIRLPPPPGLDGFVFTTILSRIRAGWAVVPHGHHNMVSMHVVLRGAVRLRQYDRVHDEPSNLVIRPRADRVCRPGDVAAISADRGNVHWFQGLADSFALIVAAYDLDPAAGPTGRDYVDPLAGEPLGDGAIRAPRTTLDEAMRRHLRF